MSERPEGFIPPPEKERSPKETIAEFKNAFEKFLQTNPEIALELQREVIETAGLEDGELIDEEMGFDFSVVKIPVEKLLSFGTMCGEVGNKAFSKAVVDYLKSLKVDFIIALSDNKEFTISSAVIPISEKNGPKLERLIEKSNGSFRCDSSQLPGWTTYESE